MTDTHPAIPPSLLIVDDEPELRRMLSDYFCRHGIDVRTAPGAAAARAAVALRRPDLVILDVHMPGEDGLSLARWLREVHPATGVLILTTADDTVDRVVGLEMGADDYVPKPFDPRELLARVRAIARRVQARARPREAAPAEAPRSSRHVAIGPCRLDLDGRRLLGADGAEVDISSAEFELLSLFTRNPHRPLNRDQIMEQAHQRGWDVFDRSVDLRVMRLRRKIEPTPDKPRLIRTVRNVGYVYVPA